MKNDTIYLDHAAATPLSKRALIAMTPYFSEQFFNPSAPYLPAAEVREAYEAAKSEIAQTIGAKGNDLVITSGATESINLAFTVASGRILISETEHSSVSAAAKKAGNYEMVKVNKYGLLDLEDLKKKITPETQFISVALVNGELGTIQPMSEIAAIIKREKQKRLETGNNTPIYLHSDASQGLGLLDVSVARLGVDLLTLNSAKIYGPKVGALWFNHVIKLQPVVVGGGQELGLRSGTENVPGVIGFAAAMTEAKKHISSERKRLESLRNILISEFKKAIPSESELLFLGNPKYQLVSFLSLSFPGLDTERLIFKLEQKGVLVSTGAACAASKGQKSHVLKAIGLSDAEIAGSLRLTLGKLNNAENIKKAAKIIVEAVREERERLSRA
jgi:cysteine desulfurase